MLNKTYFCSDLEGTSQVVPDSESVMGRFQVCKINVKFINGKLPNFRITKIISELKKNTGIFFMETDKSCKIVFIDQD